MKNILCFDASMACTLMINEAEDGNSIHFEITTDDNTNQTLEILVNGVTTSVPLASGTKNEYELGTEFWDFGDTTGIRLVNDEYESEYHFITFPEVINTDSTVFYVSPNHYTMKGSFDVEQAVGDLQEVTEEQQEEIESLNMRLLEYILPTNTDTSAISDGSSSTVMEFQFNVTQDGTQVSFASCLSFEVETTVDQATLTYGDCVLTVTLKIDGTTAASFDETYGDGDHVLTLSFFMQSVSAGNHAFTVALAPAGGTIS
ncbi:MAG: hypothetical protein J6U66_06130 [Lachnospiraceae bacterium]|nr:hypothetical protein [Lachnospiraceae bacterium]